MLASDVEQPLFAAAAAPSWGKGGESTLTAPALDRLLSSEAEVVHRTTRLLFEKRIVSLADRKHVLYRFPVPSRARRLAAVLSEAERRGIPMQRLEFIGARWRDLVRHGGCWLVTSFETGEALKIAAMNEDVASSLATSLGRLHTIDARRHGLLFQHTPGFRSFADRVNADIRLVLESSDLQEETARQQMSGWLAAHGGFLERRERFHLVHGDLLAKNILMREGGTEVCLIDYELAAFDHPGFELAAALVRFFSGRNRKFRAAFLERYLDECAEEVRQDWMAHGHYLLVASLLRMARTRIRRRSVLLSRGEEEEAKVQTGRFNGYVATAFGLMRGHGAGAATPCEMLTAVGR